jgi:hypothetical protein
MLAAYNLVVKYLESTRERIIITTAATKPEIISIILSFLVAKVEKSIRRN